MTERLSLIIHEVARRISTLNLKREEGQGVTEYGIVLAFVAVALAVVLAFLGHRIHDFIQIVGQDLGDLPGNI
jgi:Flp pilus assembly pilin Flp